MAFSHLGLYFFRTPFLLRVVPLPSAEALGPVAVGRRVSGPAGDRDEIQRLEKSCECLEYLREDWLGLPMVLDRLASMTIAELPWEYQQCRRWGVDGVTRVYLR